MQVLKDIAQHRLYSQQLSTGIYTDPAALVHHMGAMQAQDAAMVKWAIGIRLPGSQQTDIEAALDNGSILRTHVLRPTWHLVAAQDIHWMLALSAPQLRSLLRSHSKQMELTDQQLHKAMRIIVRSLEGNRHHTREHLISQFNKAGIPTDEYRSALIMMHAEVEGLVCSGKAEGNKQTYALLEERVPLQDKKDRETALVLLAERYFSSHGPATLQDFCWWSGLPLKDARTAIALQGNGFEQVTLDGQTYLFKGIRPAPVKKQQTLLLLPAFDEFLISYKDRSACLGQQHQAQAVSRNGIFRPVIVWNGEVIGLWKRSIKKDIIFIDMENVPILNTVQQRQLQLAVKRLAGFTGKEVRINA